MAETIVIGLLVDSSQVVADAWGSILAQYIFPLLQRLSEQKAGSQFHLGLVTYGPAEVKPSPLLAQRNFAQAQLVIKELKEEHKKLGIGKTVGNVMRGMAALEGYAAVMELLDLFISTREHSDDSQAGPPNSPPTCHLIHIASIPPNSAKHPNFNASNDLDDLSWKTLPEELKKRNVNLSMILLRQIPQFAELHSTSTSNPIKPWFPISSGHHLLLAGFPAQGSPKVTLKRPPEGAASGATEAQGTKRSRVGPQNNTEQHPRPQPAPSTPVAPLQQPNLAPPAPAQPSGQPNAVANMAQVEVRLRYMEGQIKVAVQQMQAFQQAGKQDEAAAMKNEISKNFTIFTRLKQVLAVAKAQHEGANPQGGQTGDGGCPAPQAGLPAAPSGTAPTVPNAGNGPVQDRQALAQLIQMRFSQPLPTQPPTAVSGAGGLPIPPNAPPDIQAQMQKLMLQANRSPHLPGQPQAGPSNQPPMSGASNGGIQDRWQGTLTWAGFDSVTNSRKEVAAQVLVTERNRRNIMPGTWPAQLTLQPSPSRAVPAADLQTWMKRHNPCICSIVAHPAADAQNESKFKSLITLLNDKQIYALSHWQLPSGATKNTIVIFPVPSADRAILAGAVFPETGVPDLPTATGTAQQASALNANINNMQFPPAILNHPKFATMSLQEKMALGDKLLTMRQGGSGAQVQAGRTPMNSNPAVAAQMLRQQGMGAFGAGQPGQGQMQHQMGGNAGGGPPPNLPSLMAGLTPQQQAALVAFQQRSASGQMPNAMPNLGNMGGMSNMDMMQSFQHGGGNHHMGGNGMGQ